MRVCIDLDGTIDAFPREMQSLMSALQAAGHHVDVVTGVRDAAPSQQAVDEKKQLLRSLGCGQCYDSLVVVQYDPKSLEVADNKVEYLKSVGCAMFIDNNKGNVKAATKAGILSLLPWGAKE
jgi:hypothetical protein